MLITRTCFSSGEGRGSEDAWPKEALAEIKDPPKRVLFALISGSALPVLLLALFSRHRAFDEILVLRCEAFREFQNLKAVAIADGPELDVG